MCVRTRLCENKISGCVFSANVVCIPGAKLACIKNPPFEEELKHM